MVILDRHLWSSQQCPAVAFCRFVKSPGLLLADSLRLASVKIPSVCMIYESPDQEQPRAEASDEVAEARRIWQQNSGCGGRMIGSAGTKRRPTSFFIAGRSRPGLPETLVQCPFSLTEISRFLKLATGSTVTP